MINTGMPFQPRETRPIAPSPQSRRFNLHDLQPPLDDLLTEVLAGLRGFPKSLPSKLFYDAEGSALFEAICDLPEYYPTRTEMAILETAASELAELAGDAPLLIEYGSGSSRKTRLLLEALQPAAYVPIDISREALLDACNALSQMDPELMLLPVCADYTQPLRLPVEASMADSRRLIFFPGSTIGNFTPFEALRFLRTARRLAGENGALLIGVDLKKDPAILNAAYNDTQGATAAFNLNLLVRLNRELDANFDLAAFAHRAFYNEALGRVEMHLVSLTQQAVLLQGQRFHFQCGETIHTENSCKYSVARFQRLAAEAGFEPLRCWTDPEGLFSVHYLLS